MIILISGASHVGKTNLAQKLMEKYHYPYTSIDHIKMGLKRTGMIEDIDGDELTEIIWPIIREMVKTMIENEQNAIIEGCYIPQNWKESFDEEYLEDIRCLYLIMSQKYIGEHFDDICKYASVIEDRGEDEECTIDRIKNENQIYLDRCNQHNCEYILIDDEYDVEGCDFGI